MNKAVHPPQVNEGTEIHYRRDSSLPDFALLKVVEKFSSFTRESFFDLSRQREVSMWIESAHLFDAPLPESADLDVELGEPTAAGLGKMLLPVRLRVPLDQVTTLPSGDGYVAGLELRVAATDADGASADLPVAAVEIRGDRPPAPGQFGVYETTLRLRRKPHRLLISLYDPVTGKVLSKRIELEL